MIVPLFGSGLAGIASYMKAGERTQHLRLLNKLLDVGKRARPVDSMDGARHTCKRRSMSS